MTGTVYINIKYYTYTNIEVKKYIIYGCLSSLFILKVCIIKGT